MDHVNPNYQFAMPYPQQPGMIMPNQEPLQPVYQAPVNNVAAVTEESYIENILRLNRGKLATFHMTYSDSLEWRDKTYKGVIEAAGRDHFIISDPKDGKRYILLDLYLDWIEFNEEISYEYPIR